MMAISLFLTSNPIFFKTKRFSLKSSTTLPSWIFKKFNVIHDDFLGAYVRESWSNFWIGTDLFDQLSSKGYNTWHLLEEVSS